MVSDQTTCGVRFVDFTRASATTASSSIVSCRNFCKSFAARTIELLIPATVRPTAIMDSGFNGVQRMGLSRDLVGEDLWVYPLKCSDTQKSFPTQVVGERLGYLTRLQAINLLFNLL